MIALLLATGAAQATDYAWPTTYGAYVSAYVDNNSSYGGTLDWGCGTHTYDGHKGTDIAGLPRNTPVYAGAAGTVIRRYDGFGDGYWGNYDGSGFGNHVALYHGGGDVTIYGHFNAYSGIPALYDEVECLDAVGGVGTSGNSTGLHLHFETRLGTDGVNYYSGWHEDPFAGACSGSVSYWTNQNGSTPTRDCADGTVYEPDFCDGKQNGLWCDGDDLVDCLYGDEASRQACTSGCTSMPLGTPDECAATSADFCDGLMNGDWCDGDDLVECRNGLSVNRDSCEWGCLSMPVGTADACATSPTFCGDKLDGLWCDGDDLVYCDDLAETSRETCTSGCESMPLGTADRCYADDACVGLMNGYWCDGSDLVYCVNDAVTSRETCPNGCTSMPLGTPDECAP